MKLNVKFMNYVVAALYTVQSVNMASNFPVHMIPFHFKLDQTAVSDQVRTVWICVGLIFFASAALSCTAAPSASTSRVFSIGFFLCTAIFPVDGEAVDTCE